MTHPAPLVMTCNRPTNICYLKQSNRKVVLFQKETYQYIEIRKLAWWFRAISSDMWD